MKKILLMMVVSLAFIGCERPDRPYDDHSRTDRDYDDSRHDVRDRDSAQLSDAEKDRMITQKIRQALESDSSLSASAEDLNIDTNNGAVTLRGTVSNSREKDLIFRKIKDIPGIRKIDNQIKVAGSNY